MLQKTTRWAEVFVSVSRVHKDRDVCSRPSSLIIQVYVRAGIYHGSEPQCQVVVTSRGAAPENAKWNEILEFAIPVADVPRAAKLCFVILGATESAMASWKR